MATNGYRVQDNTLQNGYMGKILDVDIYISRNLTQGAVSTTMAKHWLGGKKGAISFAKQADGQVEEIQNPKNADGTTRLGTEYILWSLYGLKTFTDGARELIDVNIRV